MARKLFKFYFTQEMRGTGYIYAENESDAYDVLSKLDNEGRLEAPDCMHQEFEIGLIRDMARISESEILNPEDKNGNNRDL